MKGGRCYNGYANWDDRRCRSWIYLTAVLYTTFTSQHTIGLTQHAIDIARSVLHLRTRSTIQGCALSADGHSSKPVRHLTKLPWTLVDWSQQENPLHIVHSMDGHPGLPTCTNHSRTNYFLHTNTKSSCGPANETHT